MTTTLSVTSGKTTLTIKLAADTAVITPMLDNIARVLYAQGEQAQSYADFTAAQKLALINNYVKGKLVALNAYWVRQVAVAASDAANTATLD
jgi:hypothetical protein